jgi:hypothetical protein
MLKTKKIKFPKTTNRIKPNVSLIRLLDEILKREVHDNFQKQGVSDKVTKQKTPDKVPKRRVPENVPKITSSDTTSYERGGRDGGLYAADGGTPTLATSVVAVVIVELTKESVKAILKWLKERKENCEKAHLEIRINGDTRELSIEELVTLEKLLKEMTKKKKRFGFFNYSNLDSILCTHVRVSHVRRSRSKKKN